MIFYTLRGPGYQLEVHDDKLVLQKTGLKKFFSSRNALQVWEIQNLSYFEITVPQYIFHGKIQWRCFDGEGGTFRFSTPASMVKKIELYLQKRIIKNHQRRRDLNLTQTKEEERPEGSAQLKELAA